MGSVLVEELKHERNRRGECRTWHVPTRSTFERINGTDSDEELDLSLVEYELVDKGYRLEELGLNKDLLEEFKVS